MASRTALALAPPESELCARLVEIGLGTPAMGYGVPVPWPVLLLSPSPVAGVSTILPKFLYPSIRAGCYLPPAARTLVSVAGSVLRCPTTEIQTGATSSY